MSEKPACEELEKRNQELDQERLKRKEVEKVLLKIKQRYERLVNTIPCALYDYIRWPDGRTRFVYISSQCKKIFEYDAKHIIENTDLLWNMVHLEDLERLKREDWAANQTGELFQSEVRIIPPSGGVKWIQLTSMPSTEKVSSQIMWSGIILDITERKRVEEALRKSEKKYRYLVESTDDWVWSVDIKGIHTFTNKSIEQHLGYTVEESTGSDAFQLMHPDDKDSIQKIFQESVDQKKGWSDLVIRWIHKDGSIRYFESSAHPVFDIDDNLIGFNGIDRDITGRKQAENEREQALSQLRTTLDATADGILVVDMNGKIVLFNKRFAKMWKLPESVLNSQDDSQIVALVIDQLKNPDAFLAKVKKLYADFVAKSFDTIEFNDGRIFELYSRPHLLNDEVVGRVWSFRDVTDRKLAEVALENTKKQWETTFDAMSDWVCIINKDHEIIQSNKACESIIKLSPDQAVDMRCHEIVHGMDFSILGCPLEKAINSNRLESMEFKTGDNRWLQVTVDPIETGATNDRFVHIVRDITAVKERENETILAQKAKAFSILSGGIAHDYNNLLTTIWGNISLLKEEMTHPSQQELFNDVEKACRQARDLTHKFITLSHVALLKKTSYNIEDILSSAIEKASEAKDIEISMDMKDKIPAMELDPAGLNLVFKNIICNAVEAMPDGGKLEILVKTEIVTGQKDEKDERLIKISFKDSGIGISMHDIDSVFDPYFTTKELSIQKGGGLGLAVSQSIVRKHGGNIQINSKLGQGTTITVTLPITDLKPIVFSGRKDSHPLKKPVILLMEDEPSLRKLITRMLKDFNCEVFSTSHGKAAIEVLFDMTHKNIKIDIVLLDQNITGGMGGIETLNNLRESGFEGKAIVVTGSPFSPAIIDFEKYGFDANLLKPFSKEDFKSVIGKFISL
jgi:PAS domain S-box-containing protein